MITVKFDWGGFTQLDEESNLVRLDNKRERTFIIFGKWAEATGPPGKRLALWPCIDTIIIYKTLVTVVDCVFFVLQLRSAIDFTIPTADTATGPNGF